ncbi:hypothetical protein [Burkholderia pseudomultivorans]|uniref:hypothetical protein n=1 Tax=Burkholderia pseudomultivorans TaxID=1207504 RepID=UPI0009C10570|nr:hypothetical protein [Burkholderia pseudomultivorans]
MQLDSLEVNVDFNGILIFSYPDLNGYFETPIAEGQNILKDFTQTDLGDTIVDAGVVLPIINIDDGGYLVRFFDGSPEISPNREVVFSDSGYVLKVTSELYVADAAVFWDWEEYLGWSKVHVPCGTYSVTVEGVKYTDENRRVVRAGYDIILKKTEKLQPRTAKIREDSRVG